MNQLHDADMAGSNPDVPQPDSDDPMRDAGTEPSALTAGSGSGDADDATDHDATDHDTADASQPGDLADVRTSYQLQTREQRLRVMGVFAHPDDAEFFAGGTFAVWSQQGAELTFVIATRGDKGSDDSLMQPHQLRTLREAEARAAADVLGVRDVIFLGYTDGELFPTLALRRDITRLIRLYTPDIIVTLDPTTFWYGTRSINHPDHRAIGAATLESVFPAARDRLNFVEQERYENLAPHRTLSVYIAGTNDPTIRVDVTDVIDIKMASIRAHTSQVPDFENTRLRLMERLLDPTAPANQPRYIESFRLIQLAR